MTANKPAIRSLVKALRSDRYVQGHDRLVAVAHGGLTYCCMGVACRELIHHAPMDLHAEMDVVAELGIEDTRRVVGLGFRCRRTDERGATVDWTMLPTAVADYYGFVTTNPWVKVLREDIGHSDPDNMFWRATLMTAPSRESGPVSDNWTEAWTTLANANDGLRLSFATIATMIERTFLGDD